MKGIVALANIGHETTIVNLLEDGVPVLTRDLPVGVRRLREDLQRGFVMEDLLGQTLSNAQFISLLIAAAAWARSA